MDLKVKMVNYRGKKLKLTIWDTGRRPHRAQPPCESQQPLPFARPLTSVVLVGAAVDPIAAGQERFRTLTSSYYRGAHGLILVYSVTDRESFTNLPHWLKEIDIYSTNDDAVLLLIGNKSDAPDEQRQVNKDEGRAFARDKGMLFIEASAKTAEGVGQAFDELIQKIVDVPSLLQGEEQKGGGKGAVKVEKVDDDDEDRPAQPAGCC